MLTTKKTTTAVLRTRTKEEGWAGIKDEREEESELQ